MFRSIILIIVCISYFSVAEAGEFSFSAAMSSIKSDEVKIHVDTLADDSFEGREAGTRSGRAAGNYLVELMKQYGLKPAGDRGTYFQSFNQQRFRNIIGILPGSDPKLKDEVLMIGAHYDHVGYGNSTNSFGPFGYVHNGADDNASGTAGLLELIQAFTSMEQPPRRTIAFVFWDGEEKGLLGSKHWIRQPTIDLSKINFYMNIDMIGRMTDQKVEVYGTRTSYGLRQAICYANESENLQLDITWKIKADSDHHPFFEKQIPFLMIHSGLHKDYHRPHDDAHLINNEGIESISRVLFHFAWSMTNLDEIPSFRKQSRFETNGSKQRLEQRVNNRRSRLGISWRADETENGKGLLVTRVTYQSAAYKAGIRSGDRLLEFAGIPVKDTEQFIINVQASAVDTTVIVDRNGEEEPLTLPVTLNEKPTPLGFSWQYDDAETSTILISNVVPGSLSAVSGVKLTDRIYTVNGKAFLNNQEFLDLVTQFDQPIELKIERDGRFRNVEIDTSRIKEILSKNEDSDLLTEPTSFKASTQDSLSELFTI